VLGAAARKNGAGRTHAERWRCRFVEHKCRQKSHGAFATLHSGLVSAFAAARRHRRRLPSFTVHDGPCGLLAAFDAASSSAARVQVQSRPQKKWGRALRAHDPTS